MTNAERQRRYREAHREDGRLNTYWSASSDAALGRLAAHRGLTRKAMLEALVAEAEAQLVRGWPLNERQRYYSG